MRKKLTIGVLLLICSMASATRIDRPTALKKAARMFGSNVAMQQVDMTNAGLSSDGEPAYYVFNAQRTGNGFVIVAGETDGDGILAYSENGRFDPSDMPAALRWWLAGYEQQVLLVRSGRATAHRAISRETVSPLVKTKWNQGTPFNLMLPVNPVTGSQYEHTGCVATALAQVVRYYAAEKTVSAIPSYSYSYQYYDSNNQIQQNNVTVDALEATTFNYALMQNEYYSADDDGADEVARLMRYCGQAVQMSYYEDEAAAVLSAKGLADYFGFNPNFMETERYMYTADGWDELIYTELKAGRPVLYRGQKHNNNGHAFIVDGYKDQLFHINWGWGGNYDGYFKLSECNAYGGGTGAGSGQDGYSFDQTAFVNVQPETTAVVSKSLMTVESIAAAAATYNRPRTTADFTINVTFTVWNKTGSAAYFETGVGVFKDDKLLSAKRFSGNDLNSGSGFREQSTQINFGIGYTSGEYQIKAVCRQSSSDEWQPDLGSEIYFVKLVVDGLTATCTSAVDQLTVNSVDISGVRKAGNTLTMTANVTNSGDMNTSSLFLFVNGELATGAGVNFEGGKTEDVLLHFKTSVSGNGIPLFLSTDRAGQDRVWTGTIDIEQRRAYNLSFGLAKVTNLEKDATSNEYVVKGTTLTAAIDITNLETLYYNDVILAYIFKKEDNGDMYWSEKVLDKEVTLAPGEKKNVSFDFLDLEVGRMYLVVFYQYNPDGEISQIGQTGGYAVVEDTSGIAITMSDAATDTNVYDMHGRRIGTTSDKLPRGMYVVKGKKMIVK